MACWHSLTNCAYLLKGSGRPFLERLLRLVELAPVAPADARRALDLPLSDIQDAFQAAAALVWQADAIVTRNLVHYRRSPIPAVTPAQFLKRLRTGAFSRWTHRRSASGPGVTPACCRTPGFPASTLLLFFKCHVFAIHRASLPKSATWLHLTVPGGRPAVPESGHDERIGGRRLGGPEVDR